MDVVRRYVETSDPRRISESMLAQLEDSLNNLTMKLNESCDLDPTITDWQLPFELSDAVLDALARWPNLEPSSIVDQEDARISRNEELSRQSLQGLKDEFNYEIHELRSTFESETDAIRLGLEKLSTDEIELSSRIAAQVELIGQQLPRLESQITNQREEFVNAEEARRGGYVAAIEGLRTEAVEALKKFNLDAKSRIEAEQETFGNLIGTLESDALATISKLEEQLKVAENLLQVISRTGMSGGYQKYGEEERGRADWWRWLSIGFASIATVVLAAIVLFGHSSPHVAWSVDAGRLLLSASVAGLSTYAARQSSSHRRRAEHANSLALQLASIGPYLEGLPESDKQKVLENLAYRFFTEDYINEVDDDDNGPSNWVRVFELLSNKK